MRRKFKYTFTRKEETEGGFSSLIFAGCSLLLFLVSACLSFFWEGKAESWIGALGLMAVLFSVSGFVIGMKSFKEKGKITVQCDGGDGQTECHPWAGCTAS